MQHRIRHVATFFYPGIIVAETVHRAVEDSTLESALAVAPREDTGYFVKDGWYGLEIVAISEKRYVSPADGSSIWVEEGQRTVRSWLVGERVHWTEIEATPKNATLISNIQGSTGGYGVRTRMGNWQILGPATTVVSPAELEEIERSGAML